MRVVATLLVLLVLLPAALAKDSPPSAESLDAARSLAQANNAFARELYGALRAGDENIFFSPYSLHGAMMMVREGARGETAVEMDRVLHLAGIDRPYALAMQRYYMKIPTYSTSFLDDAERRPSYRLDVANAIWAQKGSAFKSPFVETLKEVYATPLEQIDFTRPREARDRINGWAEEKTQKKIRSLIPEGQPAPTTRLMLANAIYYKAKWRAPFGTSYTKDAPFRGPKGETRAHLMHREGRLAYAARTDHQVLELPYITENTSMVFFLPRQPDGLAALETAFCSGKLKGWATALEKRLVHAYIPRFRITQGLDLEATLSKMGLGSAFDPKRANLAGMTAKKRLCIGAVRHKAFVSVDEKGTEAATISSIGTFGSDDKPDETPVVFRADHPFLFVIRHIRTGVILFMGRVTDPSS